MALTIDQIAKATDLGSETLAVPEWGGEVVLRELSFAARSAIFAKAKDAKGELDHERLALLLVVYGVAEPAMTEADVEMLRGKSGRAIERVVSAVSVLNKMSGKDAASTEAAFFSGSEVERGDAADV